MGTRMKALRCSGAHLLELTATWAQSAAADFVTVS